MSIHINSPAQVAKTFTVKREKTDDEGGEKIVAHLKISEVMIDRDQLDEICGQAIGWSEAALFDDFGAPRCRLTLTLHRGDFTATGVIDGGKKSSDPRLRLKSADLSGVTLDLTKMGALLACQLSWIAEGDEVDDIAEMLGKLCNAVLVIEDSGQKDLLSSGVQAAANSIRKLAQQDGIESVELQVGGKTIAKFDRDEPPPHSDRISSFNEAMRLIESGYHLRGASPDYWIEKPDGTGKRGVWLNAANACLKSGLVPIGDDQAGDEVGRWKFRGAA
jgi:hypothetical protein